jgi:hypothetical protein
MECKMLFAVWFYASSEIITNKYDEYIVEFFNDKMDLLLNCAYHNWISTLQCLKTFNCRNRKEIWSLKSRSSS